MYFLKYIPPSMREKKRAAKDDGRMGLLVRAHASFLLTSHIHIASPGTSTSKGEDSAVLTPGVYPVRVWYPHPCDTYPGKAHTPATGTGQLTSCSQLAHSSPRSLPSMLLRFPFIRQRNPVANCTQVSYTTVCSSWPDYLPFAWYTAFQRK